MRFHETDGVLRGGIWQSRSDSRIPHARHSCHEGFQDSLSPVLVSLVMLEAGTGLLSLTLFSRSVCLV